MALAFSHSIELLVWNFVGFLTFSLRKPCCFILMIVYMHLNGGLRIWCWLKMICFAFSNSRNNVMSTLTLTLACWVGCGATFSSCINYAMDFRCAHVRICKCAFTIRWMGVFLCVFNGKSVAFRRINRMNNRRFHHCSMQPTNNSVWSCNNHNTIKVWTKPYYAITHTVYSYSMYLVFCVHHHVLPFIWRRTHKFDVGFHWKMRDSNGSSIMEHIFAAIFTNKIDAIFRSLYNSYMNLYRDANDSFVQLPIKTLKNCNK